MLHKQAETLATTNYSVESAEICHYFADPLLLPAEDRHYVSDSLEKLLHSRPSIRRRWLRQVRSSRANMIKHGKSQLSISSFFQIHRNDSTTEPRLSTIPAPLQDPSLADTVSTAPPKPTQQFQRTPGRPPDTANLTRPKHRTNTMQQRMTAFFPGRPPEPPTPDLLQPGNPSHV